ncbi:MAG: Imm51 family immunity protein [Chitinophagales bacterium]
MKDYLQIVKHPNQLSIIFNVEDEKVMEIGEKMNEINEEAYMNGYNWEAFLNHYLAKNHPELMEGMDSDPEAGTFVALYALNPENEEKANKLVEVIEGLIENEAKLYLLVEEEGNDIEWD